MRESAHSDPAVLPRKLLFIVNAMEYFLSHRLPLAQAAMEVGWEVHVACPDLRNGGRPDLHGVTHHRWGLDRKGVNPLAELLSLWVLDGIFRSLRPDLVHVITPKATIYGGMLARWHRVHGLVCLMPGLGHLGQVQGLKGGILRCWARWGYRLGLGHRNKRVVFQNPEDQGEFLALGLCNRGEARLIRGSGFDLERFHVVPEPQGQPLVVFASRLLKEKGIHIFVEAARRIRAKGSLARFALVGDPDPGNPSSVTTAELDAWAEDGIEIWGFAEEMEKVFQACHIVCLPTFRREGIPKVLIEAAGSGRPIVTTDSPGCRDVVQDGLNGLLVPPKNVEALVQALERLIANMGLRLSMGLAGRERAAREFSMATVNDQTLNLYRELWLESSQ